ncbi:MAG: metal ABC transporter substrate-binding protein [candidate division Zixibacteria bacterium]|nr:metal ABC transporter substrate-binding protein [candidate division Zixibacteria bacterium]
MKKLLIVIGVLFGLTGLAMAKVAIVASSTDLASIAKEIGGDLAEVNSIAQGRSNLHYVEVLPSYMLKVSKADIYLKVGLGLDMWADAVIDGSRNGKLIVVDCSTGIETLERPSGRIDASMGDIHPQGNPHYWLDPANGVEIARNILTAITKADPENLTIYQVNFEAFCLKVENNLVKWRKEAESLKGLSVVSYHNTWPYLAKAFGFEVVGFIEPKPGIEPTASHTSQLIDLMKSKEVRVILREPYFSPRAPESIAKATGATVLVAPPSVGAVASATDYIALFDTLLSLLKATR